MPLLRQKTVIVPADIVRDPERLIDLLARAATRIAPVPSLLRTILRQLAKSGGAATETAPLGVQRRGIDEWACGSISSAAASCRSFYIYGTSEFWTATWCVAKGQANGAIPFGLPIANMRALISISIWEPGTG